MQEAMNIQAALNEIKNSWSSEPGVGDVGAFDTIEEALGQGLPADYKWFLMESNGGETLSPLPRLRLYPLDELMKRQADGQPPAVLEIATNDSDGFAFDLSVNRDTARYPVLRYPLGDVDRGEIQVVATHFAELVAALHL